MKTKGVRFMLSENKAYRDYKHSCDCKIKNKDRWRVLHRNHNHSHFQYPKGEEHYSERSAVICLDCGKVWRTKAKYVDGLKDYKCNTET
jgi:hypothetical protein